MYACMDCIMHVCMHAYMYVWYACVQLAVSTHAEGIQITKKAHRGCAHVCFLCTYVCTHACICVCICVYICVSTYYCACVVCRCLSVCAHARSARQQRYVYDYYVDCIIFHCETSVCTRQQRVWNCAWDNPLRSQLRPFRVPFGGSSSMLEGAGFGVSTTRLDPPLMTFMDNPEGIGVVLRGVILLFYWKRLTFKRSVRR